MFENKNCIIYTIYDKYYWDFKSVSNSALNIYFGKNNLKHWEYLSKTVYDFKNNKCISNFKCQKIQNNRYLL